MRDTTEEEEKDRMGGNSSPEEIWGLGKITLPYTMEVLLVSTHWDEISWQEPVTGRCPL